jgi:alpha-L-arabinofuranosidase
VTMANIAQFINVLQAMILTQKEKMIVTPTYHVFEMFKVHQGATSLPLELTSSDYTQGEKRIPAVSASASRDQNGKVHLSFANCDPNNSIAVDCKVAGVTAKSVSGRVLTAEAMNAHNSFDHPDAVKPKPFDGAQLGEGALRVTLPAKSVVILEL